jgi:hypothetical protein
MSLDSLKRSHPFAETISIENLELLDRKSPKQLDEISLKSQKDIPSPDSHESPIIPTKSEGSDHKPKKTINGKYHICQTIIDPSPEVLVPESSLTEGYASNTSDRPKSRESPKTFHKREVTHDMLDQNIFEDFKESFGTDIFDPHTGTGNFAQKTRIISENLFTSGIGETPKVQGRSLELTRDLFVVSVKPRKPLVQQSGVFMVNVGAAKVPIEKMFEKNFEKNFVEKLGSEANSEACVSVEGSGTGRVEKMVAETIERDCED